MSEVYLSVDMVLSVDTAMSDTVDSSVKHYQISFYLCIYPEQIINHT